MIPRYFFRSTIFNICYYLLIALSCIFLLPTLILPRRFFLGVVHYFVHTTACLERTILGLKYEIRGMENLPNDGSYIVASKHQSAYETTKLHILFKDPAIVLKRELLKIPLWGWYLAKSDQIAINRSTPKKAIESIKTEAKRVAAQNRPMVIFPQGTRVSPQTTTQNRPYKVGIVRMQEATKLPIIPLALNTGTFYPRNAWIKRPGTIIFEFLSPIEYAENTKPDDILQKIEMSVEEASSKLREEALRNMKKRKRPKHLRYVIATAFICIVWIVNWFAAANLVKKSIIREITHIQYSQGPENTDISYPVISGFPFKIKVNIENIHIENLIGKLNARNLYAQSWPFLGMPIELKLHDIEVMQKNWRAPLSFENLKADMIHKRSILTINHAELNHDTAKAEVSGKVVLNNTKAYPEIDLNIAIFNHAAFLETLEEKRIIHSKAKTLVTFALNALINDGAARTTLTSKKNKLYLGLIKIHEFPKLKKRIITRRPDNLVNQKSLERITNPTPDLPQ